MLNGRDGICTKDDFTSVSPKRESVVDYCVVPHEAPNMCSDFQVHLAMDLFKQIEDYGYIEPKHNIPDHSLLTWCIMCPDIDVNDKGTNTIQERISFTKWKLDNIPEDFLQSEESIKP